jgi:hypothetical protein
MDDQQPGDRPILDMRWNDKFCDIIKFKQKFGHLLVPKGWQGDPALATWVGVEDKYSHLLFSSIPARTDMPKLLMPWHGPG